MNIIVQETSPGSFKELLPGRGIVSNGANHPWQVTQLWDDAKLASINVYKLSFDAPAGQAMTGYTITRDATGINVNVTSEPIMLVATPRQIRLALTQLGLRDAVETYVASADQTTKDSWEFSTQLERNHPLILACASALGKTDAELDALFQLAVTL